MISTSITPIVTKAILASVVRGNSRNGQANRLYDQMIENFEMTPQWAAGHTVILLDGFLRGKRSTCSLRNQNGYIVLMLIVSGRSQYTNIFTVAYNDPNSGWRLSRDATLNSFNVWQRRARREITRSENKGIL